MENTLENKAKFFAQYWHQYVVKVKSQTDDTVTRVGYGIMQDFINSCYLQLTPLSQITDEDAIEVASIIAKTITNVDDNSPVLINSNEVKKDIEVLAFASYETVDYLRSKGYALPFMTLSVEKLIEYGWVKLNV